MSAKFSSARKRLLAGAAFLAMYGALPAAAIDRALPPAPDVPLPPPARAQVPQVPPSPATTAENLLNAEKNEANWITHHHSYSAQRFSRLNQINKSTVKNLHVAFVKHLGGIEAGGIWTHGGLEGTPLVEDGMMYVSDGWGSVYKFDVRGGRGSLLWKMDPKTDHDWAGAVACCGVDNRGVALYKNFVISHTLDGRLVATDKNTGFVKWQRPVSDPDKGEVITAAPLIVKNMAISGVGGAEYGIRGWVVATNLDTQKEAWRRYTLPAKGEAGSETWKGENAAETTGGGSSWNTGSYDPTTNTIIWGIGNPGPDWDNEYRPGDNLFTDCSLALDADTGQIKWHFQHTPNDPYDYDGVAENVMVDVNGKKLALAADRNGFAYAIDRTDGKFVWGIPFVRKLNWTRGLDPKTGRPLDYDPGRPAQVYNSAVTPNREHPIGDICPGNMGGKNWPPTAFNPQLNVWYIPTIESCNRITVKAETAKPKAREFFTGGGPSQPYRITGSVTAVDVAAGKVIGKHDLPYPNLSGMLATPDLVFSGQPSGEFYALDARTLEKLWEFDTGGGISAPPMTYVVDGKQYIALLVGMGGAWDKWFIDSTPELKKMQPGSSLYVFALQ